MSLTESTVYEYTAKSQSFVYDWAIQLYYGDESSFIGLSGKNRTIDSVQYYGVVTDFGELTESIDLARSKATIGSWTIRCANQWKTAPLSDELFYGSNNYINRKAILYIVPNDDTTLSNCMKVQWFRTKQILASNDEVIIRFEYWDPFANIKIPSTKSNNNKVYIPVIYGDYTEDRTGPNIGYGLPDSAIVHPAPVLFINRDRIYAGHHNSVASGGAVYLYEKNVDQFVVVEIDTDPYYDDASTSVDGLDCTYGRADLTHGWYQRPLGFDSTNEWGSPENAYDGTAAYSDGQATVDVTAQGSHADNDAEDLVLEVPTFQYGKIVDFKLHVDYNLAIGRAVYCPSEGAVQDSQGFAKIQDATYSGNIVDIDTLNDSQSNRNDGYTYSDDPGWTDNHGSPVNHNTDLSGDDYIMPETIIIRAYTSQVGTGILEDDRSTTTCDLLVKDVYLQIEAQLDQTNDPGGSQTIVSGITHLYSASDGFDADYTDGSASTATYIHEIYRDLMDRFGGVDYDDDYMLDWSTLNADRGNSGGNNEWFARLWILEPTPLKEILEQLQFEGGFIPIFVADSDGSGNAGMRWIYVQDTYGSAVHTLVEKEDCENTNVYTTDLSELVTKWIYNFNKHPAIDKYKQTDTYTDSTARTAWNIASNENAVEVNLDYLVSCGDNTADIYDTGSTDGDDSPNDSIVIYYDNILADPKVIVETTVVNPLYWDLQIGDIVQFNDTYLAPFGEAWGDLYFMITETRRNFDGLGIVAREVYNAS